MTSILRFNEIVRTTNGIEIDVAICVDPTSIDKYRFSVDYGQFDVKSATDEAWQFMFLALIVPQFFDSDTKLEIQTPVQLSRESWNFLCRYYSLLELESAGFTHFSLHQRETIFVDPDYEMRTKGSSVLALPTSSSEAVHFEALASLLWNESDLHQLSLSDIPLKGPIEPISDILISVNRIDSVSGATSGLRRLELSHESMEMFVIIPVLTGGHFREVAFFRSALSSWVSTDPTVPIEDVLGRHEFISGLQNFLTTAVDLPVRFNNTGRQISTVSLYRFLRSAAPASLYSLEERSMNGSLSHKESLWIILSQLVDGVIDDSFDYGSFISECNQTVAFKAFVSDINSGRIDGNSFSRVAAADFMEYCQFIDMIDLSRLSNLVCGFEWASSLKGLFSDFANSDLLTIRSFEDNKYGSAVESATSSVYVEFLDSSQWSLGLPVPGINLADFFFNCIPSPWPLSYSII